MEEVELSIFEKSIENLLKIYCQQAPLEHADYFYLYYYYCLCLFLNSITFL